MEGIFVLFSFALCVWVWVCVVFWVLGVGWVVLWCVVGMLVLVLFIFVDIRLGMCLSING